MHHYFEAITNTSGDSLVGYFARVIDPATQNTVTMSADDNGTPIATKSGVENMGSTDDYGNLDFYVAPGTYHLDIYAPNATSFIFRVPNVAMNSSKGDPGDKGDKGDQGDNGEGLAEVMAPTGSALVGFKSSYTGTIARNVQARLRDLAVSVKDFNAKGDGVTDDRASIQSAIDTVEAAGGGTVFLPAGTYRVSLIPAPDAGIIGLTMRDGVALEGAGMYSTSIKVLDNQFGAGAFVRVFSSAKQIEGVTLSNFTIDGNRSGQGLYAAQGNGGNMVINLFGGEISNVRSIEGNGQGIQIRALPSDPCGNFIIQNCIISGMSGSTLNANGSVAEEFNGNGIGIQVSQAINYKILNNRISDCKDNGIDTYNESPTSTPTGGGGIIVGNSMDNCRFGIFPETSARMLVSNNYIRNSTEGGIAVNRINSAPELMSIVNNKIEDCPLAIRVSGNATSVLIANNFIGDCSIVGIGLYTASNVLIRENEFKISNPAVPLIYLGDGQAVFCLITGNLYWNNPNPGLLTVVGSGTSIFGTVIEDWRAVNGSLTPRSNAEGAFLRYYATIDTLKVGSINALSNVGLFGATPVGRGAAIANPTDAATTQSALIALLTYLRSRGDIAP